MVGAAISAYWLLVEEASAHVPMVWHYKLITRHAATVNRDAVCNQISVA